MHRLLAYLTVIFAALLAVAPLEARKIEVTGDVSFFMNCVGEIPKVTIVIELSDGNGTTEEVPITVEPSEPAATKSKPFKTSVDWTKGGIPTDWKVTKVTRIDGSDLCKCGCCDAGQTCKNRRDPTDGQSGDIKKDKIVHKDRKDKPIDIDISCRCEK